MSILFVDEASPWRVVKAIATLPSAHETNILDLQYRTHIRACSSDMGSSLRTVALDRCSSDVSYTTSGRASGSACAPVVLQDLAIVRKKSRSLSAG